MSNNYKDQLNSSQLEAVNTIEGPVLVIAGAGSGKTRVIEYRVVNLIQNNVDPSSILLLSFTRKAAREMLSRAIKRDIRCQEVEGGTFHSFALKVIKQYGNSIGLSTSIFILDEGDAEEAIHRCTVKLGFYEREKRFPKKRTLRKVISTSINKNISIEDILITDYPDFSEYAEDINTIRKKYTEYKVGSSSLDYDDLLIYLKLLLENSEIQQRISEKYKYVMVDEYQDTNKVQGDIAYLLSKTNNNIMVVGDDAQSIYGFRGASHENIMKFPDKFSNCKVIKLEENYRSLQPILNLSNSVLANMKNKYTKCLHSKREDKGEKPKILFFKDDREEAEWIAKKIKEFRDADIDLEKQGVLFRSSYISIPVQAELSKRNIPYKIFGGLKFYETAHVKDLMCHIKILANIKDELAWSRALTLINWIGHKTTEKILLKVKQSISLEQALDNIFNEYNKGHKYSEDIKKFCAVLKRANKRLTIEKQFKEIYDYYYPILKDKYDDWYLRANDIEALQQISGRYEHVEDFLADLAIEAPEKGITEIQADPHDEKPLSLSTIHSAKGLEWEVVFLIGVVDGILPIKFAIGKEEEMEEERRLLYVGITRAKTHLFLTLHHEGTRGGISQFNRISRFIDVPSVFSKVDQFGSNEDKVQKTESKKNKIKCNNENNDIKIYDKDQLLKKLNELMDKN